MFSSLSTLRGTRSSRAALVGAKERESVAKKSLTDWKYWRIVTTEQRSESLFENSMKNVINNSIVIISATGVLVSLLLLLVLELKPPGLIMT
jgi:hypothetical protein